MVKKTINFTETVGADSTVESVYSIPKDGVLTGLDAHFYEGQAFDLECEVYLVKTDSDRYINVIPVPDDASDTFIGGNDTHPSYALRREVEGGDELLVRWTNQDSNWSYTGDLEVTFDFDDGVLDLINEVLN